jgi:hypothetical protein
MQMFIGAVNEREYVQVTVLSASRKRDSYRAGKWMQVEVQVVLEGYQAQFRGWLLHTMKLVAFRNQLADLYEYEAGLAMLKGSDGVIVIKADAIEADVIAWQGWTNWPVPVGHTLYFRFEGARQSLGSVIDQLDAIIGRYHVVYQD